MDEGQGPLHGLVLGARHLVLGHRLAERDGLGSFDARRTSRRPQGPFSRKPLRIGASLVRGRSRAAGVGPGLPCNSLSSVACTPGALVQAFLRFW